MQALLVKLECFLYWAGRCDWRYFLPQGWPFITVSNCSSLIKCKAHPLWTHSPGLSRTALAFSACFTIDSSRKRKLYSLKSQINETRFAYKSWGEVIIFFYLLPPDFPSLSVFSVHSPFGSFVLLLSDNVLSLKTPAFPTLLLCTSSRPCVMIICKFASFHPTLRAEILFPSGSPEWGLPS